MKRHILNAYGKLKHDEHDDNKLLMTALREKLYKKTNSKKNYYNFVVEMFFICYRLIA